MIHKYSILGSEENARDQLISGFLTALQTFAKEIDFPSGVSLIRSGSLEARFSAGVYVYSVLIIDYHMPLGLESEPILSGLANEVTEQFEKRYKAQLEKGAKTHAYRQDDFNGFKEDIDQVINRYGSETFELYQKLVLIEAMYAKVPQKHCIPLIEKVSSGETVIDEWPVLMKEYSAMKRAIEKTNMAHGPVWEIFAIPIFHGL